jgi:hypothetical protein
VFIGIDEKLTVVLSKTGGLESLEVQGTMSLVVGSDADAYVAAQVRRSFGYVICLICIAENAGHLEPGGRQRRRRLRCSSGAAVEHASRSVALV